MRTALSYRRVRAALGAATALTLLAALPAGADAQPADKKRRDADVQRFVKQLAARFQAWDTDANNKLDKQELAIAFRGADAKPFDYVPTTPRDVGRVLFGGLMALPPYILFSNQTLAAVVELQTPRDSGTKPDYTVYADYQFLVLAGTTGQTTLQRREFDTWARTYAQALADQSYAMRLYQNAVKKYQNAQRNPKTKQNKKAMQAALNEGQRWTQAYQTATAQLSAIPVAIHQAFGLKQ